MTLMHTQLMAERGGCQLPSLSARVFWSQSYRAAINSARGYVSVCCAFMTLIFAAVAGLPAHGQQPPPSAARSAGQSDTYTIDQVQGLWPRLTPKQQFIAVEQLLQGGQFDTAGRLLDSTTYSHSGDQAIRRFYQGMVARGQGRNAEAVAVFREVLANNPEFIRVRLELAHTLYVINEDEGARHNFDLVLGGASANPGLESVVRNYINAIEGRRRWDFTAFLTIAPSTNFNQGATERTVSVNGLPFQLADRNVKQSGVGVVGGFQAGYRHPITDQLDLVVSGGAQAKRYKDDDYNDTLVNVSIGPKFRFSRGFVGVYATFDHRWMADTEYALSYGGLVSAGYSLSAADLMFADVGCSARRFNDNWNATNLTYQDGHLCFASARFDHHFDSQTYMRVLGSLGQEETGRKHLDNTSKAIGLGIYREFPWGLSVYTQGLFTDTSFDGFYPGLMEKRHDERYDLSVNLTKRDFTIFGLAPMLQYTYTINDSSIPLHEYGAHAGALTLTKRF